MGLGANLGDRRENLRFALEGVGVLGDVTGVSGLWETAPVGGVPQGDYLNAVVVVDTILGPRPLLDALLGIESAAGRERRERWGPRTIDLDLLLYGDATISAAGLQVPHPRMIERRFVLAPLAEVWPGAIIPGHGPVEEFLAAVADQQAQRVEGREWSDRPGGR